MSGYYSFSNRHKHNRTFELFPVKTQNSMVVTLQLIGIFTMVRSVMLISGMGFVNIPVFDSSIFFLLRQIGS